MEEEYIDVRRTQERYQAALKNFEEDPAISPHNKELVLRFLRDAALGKTVLGKAKKKISPARLTGYIHQLYPLMLFTNKALGSITQEDMEGFIEALEGDQILSRSLQYVSRYKRALKPGKLSARYKIDIKVSIRKFYKWLLGDNKAYPSIVEWIDTYVEPKEIASLSEAEVEKMTLRCSKPLHRAIVQVLFDGGFRIGELLNIRLHHLAFRQFDRQDPYRKCFVARVPFSKTLRRTVALPIQNTTRYLMMWLEDHPAGPVIQEDGTIEATDLSMQLFPMSDEALRKVVSRVGRIALGKRVYPHLLRHTSATFWSNKLPYFKFCKRFGWTMTSNMPQRYIDREGVDELEVAEIYYQDERTRLNREKQQLLAELAATRTQLEPTDRLLGRRQLQA